MPEIELFLNSYGLAAIFALLLLKSIGLPIPIPADAIMLLAAARCAEGRFAIGSTFAAIVIALVIGGTVQFLLVRGTARRLLYRFGRYLGLTPDRLDTVSEKMRKSGSLGIAIAILTPGIRSVTVPACGISGISLRAFVIGLLVGSTLFFLLHFVLGFAGRSLLATLGISLPVLVGMVVALLVIGITAWIVIRRRKHPTATTGELIAEAYQCWHEATCPACLALGALSNIDVIPLEASER